MNPRHPLLTLHPLRRLRRLLAATLAALVTLVAPPAHATMPVFDHANLMQAIQQVLAWTRQYQQMVQQLKQLEQQYQNHSGIRNMAGLVNNPISRHYLPKHYQTLLQQGIGQWEAIYNAAKRFDLSASALSPASQAAQAFHSNARQIAINRAAAEESYHAASQRFADIQVLLDRIDQAPDAKDIADLQARLLAEQVMVQNEANKLSALHQLTQAQHDLQAQQAAEQRMQSTQGVMPKW